MTSWNRRVAAASARPQLREHAAGAARAALPADVLAAALAGSSDLVAVIDGDRLRWCNDTLSSLVPAARAGGSLGEMLDEVSRARFESSVRPEVEAVGRWRGVLGLALPAAASEAGAAGHRSTGLDASGTATTGLPVSVVAVAPPARPGEDRPVVVVARAAHDVISPEPAAEPGDGEDGSADPVTGLLSAVGARRRLAGLLGGGEHRSAAVLLVGLDQLRAVNEHLGRDQGDRVLGACAARLRDSVPASAVIARAAGDQFLVVLPDAGAGEALAVAIRVRAAIAEPVALEPGAAGAEASSFVITASVGLAVVPAVAGDAVGRADAVVRDAERALAEAKAAGRDRIEVHTEDLGRREVSRLTRNQVLRRALDADDVALHYQPILDVLTGQAVGAEALLRLTGGQARAGSPAELVGAAESSGLIERLGAHVLDLACRHLTSWPAPSPAGPALSLSVNVAPRQLADPDLPAVVRAALDATGVDPRRLDLEITESTLIDAGGTVDQGISFLRELGVGVGLDDFGAGGSSLAYLSRFRLDFVKIDRALIAGLAAGGRDAAIVRATIELAHELGMTVVAVGVETTAQLDLLRSLGCDRAQGHLFTPALSLAELATWLRTD